MGSEINVWPSSSNSNTLGFRGIRLPNTEVLDKQEEGLIWPEKSKNSSNDSTSTVIDETMIWIPPTPEKHETTGKKEPVMPRPLDPATLELLHRPRYGSGRMGMIEKNGEFHWYDIYTHKCVSRI